MSPLMDADRHTLGCMCTTTRWFRCHRFSQSPLLSNAGHGLELARVLHELAARRAALEHVCARGDVCLLRPEGLAHPHAMEELGHTAPDPSVLDQRCLWRCCHEAPMGGSIWEPMRWPDHDVGRCLMSSCEILHTSFLSSISCYDILRSYSLIYDLISFFRAQVNLAFNITLLWQFVGVLFTPAGRSSFASGSSF